MIGHYPLVNDRQFRFLHFALWLIVVFPVLRTVHGKQSNTVQEPARLTQSPQSHPSKDKRTVQAHSGIITGRVVTDGGRPLANVEVIASSIMASSFTAKTDREGKFRISPLSDSPYSLWVMAPGYVAGMEENCRIGDVITLTLIKGGMISGKITYPKGKPANKIHVTAIRVRDINGRPVRPTLRTSLSIFPSSTNKVGRYHLSGLEPGSYLVVATHWALVAAGDLPSGPDLVFAGESSQSDSQVSVPKSETPVDLPSSVGQVQAAPKRPNPTGILLQQDEVRSGPDPRATMPPKSYTAAEVTVRSGEQVRGIDIVYSGRGSVISGTIADPGKVSSPFYDFEVLLLHAMSDAFIGIGRYQSVRGDRGFAFYGLPDGEYTLVARRSGFGNEAGEASPPRQVTVRGTGLTGIELALEPLASLAGQVILEAVGGTDRPAGCGGKHNNALENVCILAGRDEEGKMGRPLWASFAQYERACVSEKGEFTFRDLKAGSYRVEALLAGEDYYIRSITQAGSTSAKNIAAVRGNQSPANISQNGLALKPGEHSQGLTVVLAKGAASLRGKIIAVGAGAQLPARLRVHLVPAEVASADDALRYAEANARSDGTFAFVHLAPGRYRLVARPVPDDETEGQPARPLAWDADSCMRLRREAVEAKVEIELQACQRAKGFVIHYSSPTSGR